MYTYNIDPTKNLRQFEKYSHFLITMRGVFLALLLFCASFLSPYIGCNYQNILRENLYVRYLILFIVIYFSINLVDPGTESYEDPIYSLIKSVFVFFIFLLLNAIDSSAIVITVILFTLLIITSKYHTYFTSIGVNQDDTQLVLLNIAQIALSVSIIILLLLSTLFGKKGIYYRFTNIHLHKCKQANKYSP
jgi:hypothetical protein